MTFGIKEKIMFTGLAVALLTLGLSACKQTTNPASAIAPSAPFTPTSILTGTTTANITATNTWTPSPTNTPVSTSTPVTVIVYLLGTATFTATNSPTSTPTATPTAIWTPCVNPGSFGISVLGNITNGQINSGTMFAMSYTAPSSGTLRDIQAATTQTSPIILQGGIYSDNSGPDVLLGSSGSVTTDGAGSVTLFITNPTNVPLVSGTVYWLSIYNYDPPGNAYTAGYLTSGNSGESPIMNSSCNCSVLPSTWPSGSYSTGSSLPISADYCQ